MRLSCKARQREGAEIKAGRNALGKFGCDFAEHRGELETVTAQTANDEGVIMARQGIDNKIFIGRVVIGTGGAIKQTTNAGKDVAKEVERFRPIALDCAKRFTLFRRCNALPAVVFANFERVFL